MKQIKITYHCDYCGEIINTDDDVVCVLHPGRIGYQDSLIMQPEDEVSHYHDTCMEYLLCLKASNDKNRSVREKPIEQDNDPDQETQKKENNKKDLPKLQSLLDAGWKQKDIAEEFKVSPGTISTWKQEIAYMKKKGIWEDYCKERMEK